MNRRQGGSGFSQCIEGQTDGQVTGAGTGISGDKTKRFPCGNCCNFDSTTSTVEHMIAILLLPLYEGGAYIILLWDLFVVSSSFADCPFTFSSLQSLTCFSSFLGEWRGQIRGKASPEGD